MPTTRWNAGQNKIAFERLTYRLTPSLVQSLTSIHHQAGVMVGTRLSYYRVMRLQAEATERRVLSLVHYFRTGVGKDEVARVIHGDALPPFRDRVARDIRQVVLLTSAVRYLGERCHPTTPEICTTYLDLMLGGAGDEQTHWSRFVGRDRERALEAHVRSAKAPEPICRLHEFAAADTLLSTEPVLRTALVHWALSMLYGDRKKARPAIEAIVYQDLRAGGIDPYGIIALELGRRDPDWLHPALVRLTTTGPPDDLTEVFERFATYLGLALDYTVRRLEKLRDTEERLTSLTLRPPDALDRQIFETVERLGSATSAQIRKHLRDPAPPLRTLQRRLQHLVADGLVVKHGARRDAFYQTTTAL